MCRLFGFRSVLQSQVHRSLVSADNALMLQSDRHPDGWGVAYYQAGAPHVIKSVSAAVDDQLFRRVSGVVTSETVLAHLRKATQGEKTPLDTHPFQYGRWVFAHNGNIPNFPEHREALVQRVPPVLRRFILGATDSELIFYLLLGNMSRRHDLGRRGFPLAELMAAARETVDELVERVGPLCERDDGPPNEHFLSFILTDGATMLAHQGGKDLYYSTWKQRCPDRDLCPHFSPECERATQSGFVNHLVLSSERLSGENVWEPLGPRGMIGVDWRMRLVHHEG